MVENKHILAVVKPFGVPSQPDPSGDPSLLDWARDYLGRDVHLLHRLDRPTGGIVLLGKTKAATRELSKQFSQREIHKTYLAVVEGPQDEVNGELHHHIGKLPGKNFVRAYDNPVRGSKPAHLSFQQLEAKNGLQLLEIKPHTGRRHQIRAQLRTLKLSILGDHKYGKAKAEPTHPGICLWAHRIRFTDPTGELRDWSCSPPSDFPWNEFKYLSASGSAEEP